MKPSSGGPACRCGHPAAQHDHWRKGTDCQWLDPTRASGDPLRLCDCPAYQPTTLARVRAWLHRH